MKIIAVSFLLAWLSTGILISQATGDVDKEYLSIHPVQNCTFSSTGDNPYFILRPGYQLILQGTDSRGTVSLKITVLNETYRIGNIETRVVEEYESENGDVVEISRNYFATCLESNAVYYFGEDVDIYQDGQVSGHGGTWLAEGENRPGLMMPGSPITGSKYYQEIAPGVAMDRAEIISTSESLKTPAGSFVRVLKTKESTPLDPDDISYKLYARGIGLIQDENLLLVSHGFIKK